MFKNEDLIQKTTEKQVNDAEYAVDENGFAILDDSRSLLDDEQFKPEITQNGVSDVSLAEELSTLEDVTPTVKSIDVQLKELVTSNNILELIEKGQYRDAKILGKLQLLYIESLGV